MNYSNSNCDQEALTRFDGPGKYAVQLTLERLFDARLVSQNDESGGRPASGEYWDLAMYIPSIGMNIKVEAEYAARFSYIDDDKVLVPYRKGKNVAHVFSTVDRLNHEWVWLCCRQHVHSSPVVNRKTDRGRIEAFFNVDWEKGYLTKWTDAGWTRLFRWSKRNALSL